MTSKANFVLFLTLMTMTLTLVRSCLLQRGFICVPEQLQCLRVGGRCSIVDGRCQCVPAYAFYGHNTRYAYHQAQQEYEPPSNQVEYNAEYHANMMAGAATMYRIMT